MSKQRDVFIYQDYLIQRIDCLSFQCSHSPEITNVILQDCIDRLTALRNLYEKGSKRCKSRSH